MDCFVASLPCANASRLSQAMTGKLFGIPQKEKRAERRASLSVRKQKAALLRRLLVHGARSGR
jgi:hypothetical protein